MRPATAQIQSRIIGSPHPCYIIAEAGVNHNGNMDLAYKLIDEAAKAGADAIKFQAFVSQDLVTKNAPKAGYQIETTDSGAEQLAMLQALELSGEQHGEIKRHCEAQNILYICTPYETTSVDMLIGHDIDAFKIASTDTTNIPFLRYVGSMERPVILSTGMCGMAEVELAVDALQAGGATDIILLHCTAEYPAPPEESNLRAMETMARAFNLPVGYSDHSAGIGVAPWAVVAGASVIEKHFTLDRSLSGPDHRASVEPDELTSLIETIRLVELAMGDGVKRITESERDNKEAMQKSIVAKRDIPQGSILEESDLACKRPGDGLPPKWVDQIIGAKTRVNLISDQQITLNDLELRKGRSPQ